MSDYLAYFFTGTDQLMIVFAAILCWLGVIALGGVVTGRDRLHEADILSGWAVVIVAFTVPNVFLGVRFTPIFWGVAALALLSVFVPFRRDERIFPAGAFQAVILSVPLLIIAGARMGSEWDEFSQWLPMARHLFEGSAFPVGTANSLGLSFPGYPYGWPILADLPQRLIGSFVESAGAVMNVLVLIAAGLLAARLWLLGAGRETDSSRSWAASAFAVLAGTLLSPTFVEKIVFTYYADVATAAGVAFVGVLGWMIVEALVEEDRRRASRLAWQLGLAALVLVNVKQVNVVILATIIGGTGLVALRDPKVSFLRWVALLPAMTVPALLIVGTWAYFTGTAYEGAAAPHFKPLAEWQWDLAWPVLKRMALVASNKGGYFGVMAVATAIGVWGVVRSNGPLGRFGVVVASAFVGYNGFLYATYLGFFGADDALRAASFWRYNIHLGLLATLFAAYVGGVLLRRMPEGRWWGRALGWLAILLVVAAPFGFAKQLRFDLEPPKPYYRAVARDVARTIPLGDPIRLLVLDPKGTGESKGFTVFELWGRLAENGIRYMAAFHDMTTAHVRQAIEQQRPTHILVHSVDTAVIEGLGLALQEGRSYLLVPDGERWRVLKAWLRPKGHWFKG